MPSIDMPLEQMRQYRPPLYRAPDFEPFWRRTFDIGQRHFAAAIAKRVKLLDITDVEPSLFLHPAAQ